MLRRIRLDFTARRYATAVYAVVVCPSVRPSVCHKTELYQWESNRTSYMAYRTAPLPMPLNDLEDHFLLYETF